MNTTTDRTVDAWQHVLRSKAVLVALLVTGLALVGVGWRSQQALEGAHDAVDSQHRQIVCVKAWARDFTRTTTTRVDATSRLERAKDARDAAVDDVLGVFVRATAHPDDPAFQHSLQDDLIRALRAYHVTLEHYHQVKASVQHTRVQNHYPRLEC